MTMKKLESAKSYSYTYCASLGCNLCDGRHHTSLYDKRVSTLALGSNEEKEVLRALCDGTTLHPTVVAHI